jgi:small-conductance mechanosensitive channel
MLYQVNFFDVLLQYLPAIIISAIIILIGFFIYKIIKNRAFKYLRKRNVEEATLSSMLLILKILIVTIIFSAILAQFAESLSMITTLITLVGGTIIGFAAINTLGNFIAGIIIITSKPYSVGDRISYHDRIADIVDINLIYTVLIDLDHVKIYVPNSKVLSEEIVNFGKKTPIRRGVELSIGYDVDRHEVEKALLEAAKKTDHILQDPAPYVWIMSFGNYSVIYKLFIFVNEVKKFRIIDSDIHKAVLDSFKAHNIDIATPMLINNTD